MSSIVDPKALTITGVVLAGGRGSRMGGMDKGLIDFQGKPLVAYSLAALEGLAHQILISANRNLERYAAFGYPVIPDAAPHFDGPLAGLLSAMHSAETTHVMVLPCDSPRMTANLLRRLVDAVASEAAEVSAAHDGQRLHPVFLLAQRDLRSDLEQFLRSGERKVERWLARHRLVLADFSDRAELFVNVNTPDDLRALDGGRDGHQAGD